MKATRDEIVSAARELFREKGYAGASMQDLADRVGLRKASLYMRFANKEALVPEVLDLTARETAPDAAADDAPWQETYARLIRGLARDLADRKRCVGFHLAYGVGDETPVAKAAVRAFFLSLQDRLVAILGRALPRETAARLATDALVRIEGATLMSAVFGDTAAMERAVRAVVAEAEAAARETG